MEIAEFYRLLDAYRTAHPEQRLGQAASNVAWREGIYIESLRGTYKDPFYQDLNYPAFIKALIENGMLTHDHQD